MHCVDTDPLNATCAQYKRLGAGSAWPGYRLGGAHVGGMVTSSIAAVVSLVAGASSFNLLVSYPTGTTATIHCGASPCAATFDQLQGNPALQIQYLSASGAVLATQPYPSAISLN